MIKLKKWRHLLGLLKDKSSLLKQSMLLRRQHNSSIPSAVIRATTHDASTPPSDDHIEYILHLGQDTQLAAQACIEALMDRLHRTHNAAVALKCLMILHSLSMQGSVLLKDQFAFYPLHGGHNFLNLSKFHDRSDVQAMEMSSWVRWYAGVVEQNMIVSRVLNKDKEKKVKDIESSDLLRGVEALVGFVEQVCDNPSSLYLQKKDLIYDVVRLVGGNYRLVQLEILIRVQEWENREVCELSLDELIQSLGGLQRLESCRDGLVLLFANRQRNDVFWESNGQTKRKLLVEKERREEKKLVLFRGDSAESTGSGQFFRFTLGGGWRDVDRVHFTVSATG